MSNVVADCICNILIPLTLCQFQRLVGGRIVEYPAALCVLMGQGLLSAELQLYRLYYPFFCSVCTDAALHPLIPIRVPLGEFKFYLFARTFYKVCRDVVQLADVLGHSSVETTRIYLASTGDEYVRRMDRLGLIS